MPRAIRPVLIPSAIMPTMVATGIRSPRMHGTPSIWSARTVIRVNAITGQPTARSFRFTADLGRPRLHCNAPGSWAPSRAEPDLWEDIMSELRLTDVIGRLRSPAATPGHFAGCTPANKNMRYPADPPTVEEIILVMRQAGPGPYADRIRALIAILWRAGLRISEAIPVVSPHRHTSPDQSCGTRPSVSARVTGSTRRCAGTGSLPDATSAWRGGQPALGVV